MHPTARRPTGLGLAAVLSVLLAVAVSAATATMQCGKYSNETILVDGGWFRGQGQPISPLTFPKKLHKAFDINAWCYFGRLAGQKATYGFLFLIQKVNPVLHFLDNFQIGGGIYSEAGNYDLGGCLDVGLGVTTTDQPWSTAAKCLDGSHQSVTLTSGEYGRPGATYSIVLHTTKNKLDVVINVRDVAGMVNQGNGPNSFLLNWVTPAQRTAIMESYGGSVAAYQEHSGDDMACQGSHYFSQPNLKVTDFKITKGGVVVDESAQAPGGDGGVVWFDYVAQTYNKAGKDLLKNVGWLFFAMSFPDQDRAMMVTQIETANGQFPLANLFVGGQQNTTWNLQNIHITPDQASAWTSPKSQKTYYMHYTIDLVGPDLHVDITTLWKDQEIGILNTFKYEGLGEVVVSGPGLNGGENLVGSVWLELTAVQPVQTI